MTVPRVLTIAGTDPTGGAGLQADLKAIAAHDGYGMGVVTALVAQNTTGVRAVHVPGTAFLREQLDAVSDDVTIDAVKVGMLGTAEVVSTVTTWLAEHRPPVVVVDPVMVATSGDRLLSVDAEAALTELFAHADLLTPNRAELGVLTDLARRTAGAGATPADGDAPGAGPGGAGPGGGILGDAELVARTWDVLVLAKGGHDAGPTSDDVLVAPDGSSRVFRGRRIRTANTHGTGCSLSSAIATLAARHGDWELAVGAAKRWLTVALEHADALDVGAGNGPVDHGAATRAVQPTVPWTQTWWEDVADVRAATLDGEFLRRLADGTLPSAVFDTYLAQDVHYLRAYGRHLATLADRSSGPAAAFWRTAADGCAAEARDLHHRRLGDAHTDDPVHPVCAGYLAHLQAAADTGSTAVLAAAVLPCFRVYAWVGTRLGLAPEGHPYADWISAYGDPGFAAASAEATEQVERLAAAATPAERGRMARAHRRSTVWEEAFFRMAL
ncbi:bifunctional hydroxymethylpyrimidine kinase/phosphomethylpyrimidine kinase [Curtobacterium luteum]|uniref:Uncharacterized protein n=1 Tax=Curtobacterium luteum TaxID=33881 RepID=A0A175RI01_9MICO|nr:bifunctional hydroxymethylpyrimidine kinase/phosphomethylpyrimidine kinase [Curtobacterium luteum]KTR03118.1 hypothetical protein NS184_14325 [Curtobacterium luteum]